MENNTPIPPRITNDEVRNRSLAALKKKYPGYAFSVESEIDEIKYEMNCKHAFEKHYRVIKWKCVRIRQEKRYQQPSYNNKEATRLKITKMQNDIEHACESLVKFGKMKHSEMDEILGDTEAAMDMIHRRGDKWDTFVDAMQQQLDALNEMLLPQKKDRSAKQSTANQ